MDNEDSHSRLLQDWDVSVDAAAFGKPGHTFSKSKKASPAQCFEIAQLLELEAIDAFACSYQLETHTSSLPKSSVNTHLSNALSSASRGRFRLEAEFYADVRQNCAITLASVSHRLSGTFSLMLWPTPQVDEFYEQLGRIQDEELDLGDVQNMENDPEPYEGNTLPVGMLIYEHLANLVDPYFKAEGAQFTETATTDTPSPEHPFAILKQIKQ